MRSVISALNHKRNKIYGYYKEMISDFKLAQQSEETHSFFRYFFPLIFQLLVGFSYV